MVFIQVFIDACFLSTITIFYKACIVGNLQIFKYANFEFLYKLWKRISYSIVKLQNANSPARSVN